MSGTGTCFLCVLVFWPPTFTVQLLLDSLILLKKFSLFLARVTVKFCTDIRRLVGWDLGRGMTWLMKKNLLQTPFLVQILVKFGGILFFGKIKGIWGGLGDDSHRFNKTKQHTHNQKWYWHTSLKVVPNHNQPTNQPKQYKIATYGIYCGKKRFLAPKPKINCGFPTVPTEWLLDSRSKRQAHKGWRGRKSERRGVLYDRGLGSEKSLETRVHASWTRGTFCIVTHGHPWVCALIRTRTLQLKFNNKLFHILFIQRSRVVVFSLFFYWCLLGHCHIWQQTYYFPVRLRLIPRPEKIVTTSVYVVSHPLIFLISLWFARKNFSSQSWIKFVPGKGSAVHKNSHKETWYLFPNPSQPTQDVCL